MPARESNLAGVKLLGRKKDNPATRRTPMPTASDGPRGRAKRPAPPRPKGRPTPKRSEAAAARGPVAPAPMTTAEARERRKETARSEADPRGTQGRERSQRRADMSERREKMMAGEDAYLLPRDKGPVRRYVRDVVDSRRNVLGLFMPAALGLIFVMLAVPSPRCSGCSPPPCWSWWSIMVIDGFILGRKVNRLVDEKFPDNTESPVGSSASTPPAALRSCAGCVRRGRRSNAAPVSGDGLPRHPLTRCRGRRRCA